MMSERERDRERTEKKKIFRVWQYTLKQIYFPLSLSSLLFFFFEKVFKYSNPKDRTMKYIQTDQILDIPEGVTVDIKARVVKVTGPRGELTKDLKHIDVTFNKINNRAIKITVHNGDRKHVAALRTVKSLIANLITGVTKGYKYKMRFVYAHFPINVNIIKKDGQDYVEIRNFLGEKRVREVKIHEGVTMEISSTQKDELIVSGNSLEAVSQNAADIQQICRVRNKDIRKFLDGIYVSERGTIVEEI
ncbi:60S ribosomal protein L9-B [Candida albicans P78042]|nr:60S ribosomal protein L9-B [Candida albicans P78042]KHC79556.1 60S ribosomal protein L9-B [Candida albicans P78042]